MLARKSISLTTIGYMIQMVRVIIVKGLIVKGLIGKGL